MGELMYSPFVGPPQRVTDWAEIKEALNSNRDRQHRESNFTETLRAETGGHVYTTKIRLDREI